MFYYASAIMRRIEGYNWQAVVVVVVADLVMIAEVAPMVIVAAAAVRVTTAVDVLCTVNEVAAVVMFAEVVEAQ
jgi:hypothetical protein